VDQLFLKVVGEVGLGPEEDDAAAGDLWAVSGGEEEGWRELRYW
jgi:hypothetical protein